jgi:lambda family phage portal protein
MIPREDKPRIRATMNQYSNLTTDQGVEVDPAYSAASQGRRVIGYGRSSSGPNSLLKGSITTIRNRARHATRNSALIKKALFTNTNNEIGTGILTRFSSKDKGFNETLRVAHDVWSNECSSDGVFDWYGNQWQITNARRLSGDCFIRRRRRRLNSGLLVPMQIQVLEADFVPHQLNKTLPNGNKIKQGIEFNKIGTRVAYWMYKSHPGEDDAGLDGTQLIRIPSRDVIHSFRATRPGMIRGEPEATTSILQNKTFDQYNDFELVRKESRSAYTGMLTRQDFEDVDFNYNPFDGKPIYEEEGQPELGLLPGTVMTGLPGESLTLFEGDNTGSGYADFQREQKLGIAAAQNIPFELMTGDWKGVNDRVYRAFINEYRRGIEADQDHLAVFQVCRVVKDWFIQAAILADIVQPKDYLANIHDYHTVVHQPQAWKYIHPEQDVKSKILEIENNLASTDSHVGRSGQDPEVVDAENILGEVRRNNLRKEAGLGPKEDLKDKKKPSPEKPKKKDDEDDDE